MAEPQLLTDLRLKLIDSRALSIYVVREGQRRLASRSAAGRSVISRDLELVSDLDNLAQAITIRLLTPKGELAALAHADYGCRLHELIGFANTAAARNLAKLYVIEALKQERRIAHIKKVEVTTHAGDRQRIDVFVRVLPIGRAAVLDVGPFTLDLG
jgi:phage baseplate assembly protein W